jgi:hypothetical protein
MDTITAAMARARIDRIWPGHDLTPAECIELADLFDENDTEGLAGAKRERCEELMYRACTTASTYYGPDERY